MILICFFLKIDGASGESISDYEYDEEAFAAGTFGLDRANGKCLRMDMDMLPQLTFQEFQCFILVNPFQVHVASVQKNEAFAKDINPKII